MTAGPRAGKVTREVGFLHLPAELGPQFVNYPTFSILGPLWCAAALIREGHVVRFWDALTRSSPGRLLVEAEGRRLVGRMPLPDEVLEWAQGLDMVVFPLDVFRDPMGAWGMAIARIAGSLRRAFPLMTLVIADCHVGGSDYLPQDPRGLLAGLPDVDFYLRGQSESGLVHLAAGDDWWTVAGLWGPAEDLKLAVDRGRIHHGDMLEGSSIQAPAGPWGRPPSRLDELGSPAFGLLDMERFFEMQAEAVRLDLLPEFHGQGRILPLATSRGCPYGCAFCAGLIKRFQAYSPEGMANLLSDVLAFGPTHLFFLDDAANLDEKRFGEVCDRLAEAGGGRLFLWTLPNGLRADRLRADTLARMARCGAFGIKVSAETADPVVMDWIGKKLDPRIPAQVAADAASLGLDLQIHYLVGLPVEEMVNVNRTLQEALRLFEEYRAKPRLQFAVPMPGTVLAREAEAHIDLSGMRTMVDLAPWFQDGPLLSWPGLDAGSLHLAVEAFRARLRAAEDPLLMLDVTYRCNQACRFCALEGSRRKEPDIEEMRSALAWAEGRGIRRLDLSGGEPTLFDGLPALMEFARDRGIEDLGIVTNGRRLAYRHYAKRLLQAGVDRFVVSVAGSDARIADAITRVPGSLAQTLAGLDNLAALGQSAFLNVTVFPENLAYLPETVSFFAERFSLAALSLQCVVPMGGARMPGNSFRQPEDWHAVAAAAREAVDAVNSAPGTNSREVTTSVLNVPPCLLGDKAAQALSPDRFGQIQWTRKGPVWFHRTLGSVLGKPPSCRACALSVLCKGLDGRLAAEDPPGLVGPDRLVGLEESLREVLSATPESISGHDILDG